ncbi:hypothetical protein NGA_0073200 [Nannochloropsis gaditana CCMP526]|uniref:uncharacterized protein n=1 Tax=Nannochloropsis gaditana (strain CCMP526) TaxID=1093141 RepID=UPI00029F5112|nr:hypothetical protein NGA_0073200 [Nannochloropsis gaditana CCMP526]EKU21152.1 hypothetical protein NGA_0073200 [Nannochloropsis gaditana CCMP526]|eukprot:XP_005855206.1 hypothetical protein NGA_0073200 [Nannochloropsis gaditana CCMP526]
MFWILQDVMPRQDLHYLGDYGQDFVAVVRYFVQNFFLAHEIETLFVHDGGYNPAKAATQQSRRARRALLAGDLILRVFARLRESSETRNTEDTSESFLDLAHGLTKGLRKEDVRVAKGTGVTAALYLLLDELDATSHAQGGPRVRQVNTIMEADAYIARTCMRGAYAAVLSSDSDFLVLDTPWIPLQSIQHRYAPTACPCSWVPPGRFSEVLYALAWNSLVPFLRLAGMVTSQRPTIPHCSLAGFRKLLGDLATLLGNDFYSLADAGNAVGQVTVRLTGRGEALGRKDGGHCPPPPSCMPSTPVALTCKLTDKVACARFLLVCLCNGWVEEPGGSLALSQDSVPLPSLLFPQAPRQQAQYVRARCHREAVTLLTARLRP